MTDPYQAFLNPSHEFTQVPFWFWNDEVTEKGIREQLADFRRHGIHGFIIHARMGLARSIPYLGKRWFELVRFAVEEAARHDMIVHLYDEGMYPSGSAHGEVVAGHPEFLARGLEMRRVESPEAFKLNVQEKCVAFLPDGRAKAVPTAPEAQIPRAEPGWIFIVTLSNGTIRGVHEGEDDGEPGAPFAADLLNPKAVRRFIRCTHERYYRELEAYFGDPIQAIFTDEPNIMGRYARQGLIPWTEGLETDFREEKGYDLIPLLPALFGGIGPHTASIREDYEDVVADRLDKSFYKPLSDWCAAHRIALTGHPAQSDDIGPLRYFQFPGQDTVLRHIEPEKPSALEGRDSTAGKCSSSAAQHRGARRNGNEVFGGYGWSLTFDEMKGLSDWLMVRGVNLLWPHAFYYSIRGIRAQERPPDVGPHNLWWEHYALFANYTKRLCGLLTDSEQVCELAIMARHNHLPWEPAKALFQHQWNFNYVEDRLLTEAVLSEGRLRIGEAAYSTLIRMPDQTFSESAERTLEKFVRAGGHIVPFDPHADETVFLKHVEKYLVPDVDLKPAHPDLRYVHVRKGGWEFYYLANEGSNPIAGRLTVRSIGLAEWWDPLTGKSDPAVVLTQHEDTMGVALHLERREGRILAIDPQRAPILQPDWKPRRVGQTLDFSEGWKLQTKTGEPLAEQLIDWTTLTEHTTFSGTLFYENTVDVSHEMRAQKTWTLDLGEVRDFAEVFLNGDSRGVRLWAPFRFELPLKPGRNTVRVGVTNSMFNQMEGGRAGNSPLPSGMLGPVRLEAISD